MLAAPSRTLLREASMLLLLLHIAFASDDEPPAADISGEVEVAGVGTVPLSDAIATCVDRSPIGAVAEADADRVPALTTVLQGLLTVDEETRNTYFSRTDGWPHEEVDATYVGSELPWDTRAIATTCTAAGLELVRRGIALREACDGSKSDCREAFPASEHDRLSEALKSTRAKGRRDKFLAEVARAEITSWISPRPLLEASCALPQQAATAERFIDQDDLEAAQLACVQLLLMIDGDVPDLATELPCNTPWRDGYLAGIVETPTDLGVTDRYPDAQRKSLLDKLNRMDPFPAACASPWASSHRGLDDSWLERQQARACTDAELALPDRLHLCPDLAERAEKGCRAGDHHQCHTLASMYMSGVGMEQDERAALDVWQDACHGADADSCASIVEHKALVQGWFDEAVAAPPPAEGEEVPAITPITQAMELLVGFGDALGQDWVSSEAVRVFEAALAHEDLKVASDVVSLYSDTLGREWAEQANEQVNALKKTLEERAKANK